MQRRAIVLGSRAALLVCRLIHRGYRPTAEWRNGPQGLQDDDDDDDDAGARRFNTFSRPVFQGGGEFSAPGT